MLNKLTGVIGEDKNLYLEDFRRIKIFGYIGEYRCMKSMTQRSIFFLIFLLEVLKQWMLTRRSLLHLLIGFF